MQNWVLSKLKETNKTIADYKVQPALFGASALLSLLSVFLKLIFHASVRNTLCSYKNQNIGGFFRKQRRLSLLWDSQLLFAIAISCCATAGIWGIAVNEKASAGLTWTEKIAHFLKMESSSSSLEITSAESIFSISSSGLLLLVFLMNGIANATKGLAFVRKILRRGVERAFELQQGNSIRSNIVIIEVLQTISLFSLLGFGGFMALHIAGKKDALKNRIWAVLTEEYKQSRRIQL